MRDSTHLHSYLREKNLTPLIPTKFRQVNHLPERNLASYEDFLPQLLSLTISDRAGSNLIQKNILDGSNILQNQLVQFKDSLVNDLTTTGNMINTNIKQQLGPLASSLTDMMTNLFSGFMSNLQQQQDQSSSLTYLPIIGIGILGIFLIKK